MARIAVVDNEKLKQMEEKLIIQGKCPVNRTGADCMYFEGEKLLIDEILCIGCGICSKAAPHAISIINFPDESKNEPIHQFGKNGFRIFSLPMVQEQKITGIIGRNGIGKSTVINTLSKTMKANFGDVEQQEELSDEEYFKLISQKFKGTVLQTFFDKLKKGETKVSYKPQQIVNIPKMFKGEVLDLFKKIKNDEKIILELAQKLNISQILNRDITVLSGGELQRVAICAALLKDECNFYVFDEITNYLDIYERLNSSKLIKEKTNGKTALVVEHDLIVLDYLVDFAHIMYGQPSVYGMLTNIKSGKVGINEYLEGFAKEENVKFRDKPISFDKDTVVESQKVEIIAQWEEKDIQVGDFKLHINSGNIKRGEVMGVIGRNALGKSTFIKYVAENGFEGTTVAYKPQLIEKNDDLVMSDLAQYAGFDDPFFKVYVLEPLNIEPLLERQIDKLSGGELQRYAIAKCLLEDREIYLLDEPTAFLDVEDRLKVAKMLKNFIEVKGKSAFIIDHDLVFMDYLSHKLQVFQGEPSIKGEAHTPLSMRDGMNLFLKELGITFRRDDNNKRPRVNKEGSVKDQEQKKVGEYYYS